jgi:hypothetical protein
MKTFRNLNLRLENYHGVIQLHIGQKDKPVDFDSDVSLDDEYSCMITYTVFCISQNNLGKLEVSFNKEEEVEILGTWNDLIDLIKEVKGKYYIEEIMEDGDHQFNLLFNFQDIVDYITNPELIKEI